MSSRITTVLRPFLMIVGLGAVSLAINATLAPAAEAQELQAASQPVPVKDHDLYVDLPTGFAFIKLPEGWKFIGKLDASQLGHLPPGTLTALLQDDPAAGAAQRAAAAPTVMLAKATQASVK